MKERRIKFFFNNGTHLKNTITDYHWSLSFTINAFLNRGFSLEKIYELKDIAYNKQYSNNYNSPYILLKFKL